MSKRSNSFRYRAFQKALSQPKSQSQNVFVFLSKYIRTIQQKCINPKRKNPKQFLWLVWTTVMFSLGDKQMKCEHVFYPLTLESVAELLNPFVVHVAPTIDLFHLLRARLTQKIQLKANSSGKKAIKLFSLFISIKKKSFIHHFSSPRIFYKKWQINELPGTERSWVTSCFRGAFPVRNAIGIPRTTLVITAYIWTKSN